MNRENDRRAHDREILDGQPLNPSEVRQWHRLIQQPTRLEIYVSYLISFDEQFGFPDPPPEGMTAYETDSCWRGWWVRVEQLGGV